MSTTRFTKALALFLGFVMLIGVVPIAAFAETETKATAPESTFATAQLSVVKDKMSVLATGVSENLYTVYNKNGEQVKMYATTIDASVDSVKMVTSYKNMDNSTFGMSKLTEQVAAFNKKAEAGDEYYQGTVVAGINASYYNMSNGKPTGVFVMNGNDVTTESEGNSYGYFAVMKDGTVKIGNKGDYSKDKGNIQEAFGIYTMLIVDGNICGGLDDSTKYPRQTIGITADGKVVILAADGQQAPVSAGLTLLEQARAMYDLGCVWAGHLDGGGSMTYGSRPEGENEFKIVNSPADGSERAISNGFIIVSTAVSDGKFDHAVVTVENEYVTPGSTVSFSAIGVDKAGGSADLPINYTYEATNGTIEDGKFISDGTVGDATVSMIVDGISVGSATIHVVMPTSISFAQAEMIVPFGKTVELKLNASYGKIPVTVKPSDITFSLANDAIGTIDGFSFTAANEETTVTSSVITAKLNGTEITASASLGLGKGSDVLYDFEDGEIGNWQLVPWSSTPSVITKLSNVTSDNGIVHSGNNALKLEIDYTPNVSYGYSMAALKFPEDLMLENATRIGMWMYLPDEFVSLWARYSLYKGAYNPSAPKENRINGGTFDASHYDTTATGFVNTIEESGWYYFSFDLSQTPKTYIWKDAYSIEIYASDRDGDEFGYTYVKDNQQINTSAYGKYTLFIDDITVDYSSAVDDREAPVFGNVSVMGTGESSTVINRLTNSTAEQIIPEFYENVLTISAPVAENTVYSNATGLNESSAKCFVDDREVECKLASGSVVLENYNFTNGIHTIKFAISDNIGNSSSVVRKIKVSGKATNPTMTLVPHDPTADKIKAGSLYYVDLKTDFLADVSSVSVVVDINSVSKWGLPGLKVANGFDVSYEEIGFEDSVKFTFTRNGDKVEETDALASIPVRAWYHPANVTPSINWKDSEFSPSDLRVEIDNGEMIMSDGSVVTFTGERIRVDTEIYGNYAVMNAAGDYANRDGWHVHTPVALPDTEPTCREAGYIGRTYCSVCKSVVDWGDSTSEKLHPTGHSYVFTNGILKCENSGCDELYNGIYADGKTYVDGVIVSNGWHGEAYYIDGVKLTGLQSIEGYYYDFGADGICEGKARLDGFYYDTAVSGYRYFAGGIMTVGDISINFDVHFFDVNGVAVSGTKNILGYVCSFDEKGSFISSDDNTVLDAGYVGANLKYVLLSNGTLKIDGEGQMRDYGFSGIYAPWFYAHMSDVKDVQIGADVTGIGYAAFNRCEFIKTVTIAADSKLETISSYAFRACHRLDSINIPASVKVIADYAFFKCGALTTIEFASNSALKTIGREAFAETHLLKEISIPAGVINIGDRLFARGNADIKMCVVKESAAYFYAIEKGIAYELVDGYVPPMISGSFNNGVKWELYPNGVLEISGDGVIPDFVSHADQPWASVRGKIKKIVIGKDITYIGNYAFAYCENNEAIVFESGSKLEKIGVLSFRTNRKVTEVVLPDSVTYLNSYAFGTCDNLKNVYIPQGMSFMHAKAFIESPKVNLNVAAGTYAEQYAKDSGVPYTVR